MIDVNGIAGQWLEKTYDYESKLAQAQRPWLISAAALCLGILALILVLFQIKRNESKRLAMMVKERTAELENANHANTEYFKKIREAHHHTQIMMDAMPICATLWDRNNHIFDCNEASVKLFEAKDKQEFTDHFFKYCTEYQPDGRLSLEAADAYLKKAFEDGACTFEWMHQMLDGTPVPCEMVLIRVAYGDDNIIAAYARDLREHKKIMAETFRLQAELEAALKETQAASRAKSDFLATMSHEIRTPMNAILGITEIQLLNESMDQSIRDAFDKIYASSDLLLGIINDILDHSKIEAGKLPLVIAKYESASLVSDTAQLNMMRIGSKLIEFDLCVDENMPAVLLGDELRIKQILNNLLSNAFKYTAKGTVQLSVSVEATGGDDEVMLVISVSDTGQGMTEEQLSKLFEEYARFNMDANRTTEGVGLGMSITQKLIHLMNGKIFVKSEPGKGSVFTVHLPQVKVGAEVLGRELSENLHKFRTTSRAQMRRVQFSREPMPYGSVLIVDDVETNIYVAKGLLSPYELNIDTADSGFSAIEKIKNGKEYDIVLMDHMMPGMDGIEAVKILRGMGYKHSIVALTANAVAGQAEIFLNNGFDDYISKPIDIRQLNVVLNKLIRDKQAPDFLEAVRRQAEKKTTNSSNNKAQAEINPRFAEIFIRDAQKSLAMLEAIMEKQGAYSENDMRLYIIHVHGMKGALANIGRMELSAVALKLEQTGRDGNTEVMISETSAFLSALRQLIEELAGNLPQNDGLAEYEDIAYLREKLLEIKSACEYYDERAADKTLSELRKKAWPQPERELLNSIDGHLLHCDFEEVVDAVNQYLSPEIKEHKAEDEMQCSYENPLQIHCSPDELDISPDFFTVS